MTHSSTVLPDLGNSTGVAIYVRLSNCFQLSMNCPSVRCESPNPRNSARHHAIRLVGAREVRNLLEAANHIFWYRTIDAQLVREILRHENLLVSRMNRHQQVGAGQFRQVVRATQGSDQKHGAVLALLVD